MPDTLLYGLVVAVLVNLT